MADEKKSKSQEQTEGKPAIVQARDFKTAGSLEQAKKFALKEVEMLKRNKKYTEIIQVAKEFSLEKQIVMEAATGSV